MLDHDKLPLDNTRSERSPRKLVVWRKKCMCYGSDGQAESAAFDEVVPAEKTQDEAPILIDVHRNPNANHRELWIRGPDGYTVVLASPDGDAEEA